MRIALYARPSHPTAVALTTAFQRLGPEVRVCGARPDLVRGLSDRDGSADVVVVHDHHHGKTGLLRSLYPALLFLSVREIGDGNVEVAVCPPEEDVPTLYLTASLEQVAEGTMLAEINRWLGESGAAEPESEMEVPPPPKEEEKPPPRRRRKG